MSLDAFIGILIGSGISILVTYLNHRWTKERESEKLEMQIQNEAISQVFSPLVFILQNTRNVFAAICAIHTTLRNLSKIGEKTKNIALDLGSFPREEARHYSKILEDLLMQNARLIKPVEFYSDLFLFHGYLSTLPNFIPSTSASDVDLKKFKQSFSALAPLLSQLDEVISQMRQFAMVQTAGMKREYKQFFTEKKISELESYLDKVNVILTGKNIPPWQLVLKGLHEDRENDRLENE